MVSKSHVLPRAAINLLVPAYLGFIVMGVPVSMMGVAWPTLRGELGLPLDALGLLLITSNAGYILSSFLIARLVSRFGIGPLLITSALLCAAAYVGYTVVPSWAVIVILGAAGGLGLGAMDAGLNTYLAAEYPPRQMQWLHASFGFGATLSPLIMTVGLAIFDSWRPGYIFAGALMLVMALCFYVTLPAWKRPKQLTDGSVAGDGAEHGLLDYRTSLWATLLRAGTWVSILMFLLYAGAQYTLGNWTYTLFTEGRGISPELAGIWAGGYWATFTVGRVLAGLYAHRVKLGSMMTGVLVLAVVGAILLWWNPLPLVGVAGVFVVGLAIAPIFPGLVSTTAERVGQRHAANTIGMQISAAGLGGALLPALAGTLAQQMSLETIPVLLFVIVLLLLGLYVLSARVNLAK